VWVTAVKEALGWQMAPTSLEEFIVNWLDAKRYAEQENVSI
jgi:hypothetical protein